MQSKISKSMEYAWQAALRYPLMLLSALVFELSVQGLIDNAQGDDYFFLRVSITASIGISLFFGLQIWSERIGQRLPIQVLGLIFLVLVFFGVLPREEKDFTQRFAYIIIPIYLMTHLLVAIAPYLYLRRKMGSNEAVESAFWEYNKNLFIHLCITGIFALVLASGATLGMIAIQQLFHLDLNQSWSVRVFLGFLILGSALIFAIFNKGGLIQLESPSPYPPLVQFFTQFILIPLLIIYAGILYAYSIKIVLEWSMPSGWVSYLVLAYACCGILALLLVHPLIGTGNSRLWVSWFRKVFYITLLPLMVLLFAAIGLRIGQYGYTEARYFLLALAIWITLIALYQIICSKPKLQYIPISLFFMGLTILITPFFNVYQTSLRSQANAAMHLLRTQHVIGENGKLNTDSLVKLDVIDELQNKYNYLVDRNHAEAIESILSAKQLETVRSNKYQGFRSLFSQVDMLGQPESVVRTDYMSEESSIDISQFRYYFLWDHRLEDATIALGADSVLLRSIHEDKQQRLILQSADLTTELLPLLEEWVKVQDKPLGTQTVRQIQIPFRHGQFEGIMQLPQLSIHRQGDQTTFYFNQVNFFFK